MSKYYSLDKILKLKAQYYMIYGERSSGKTYACLEKIIKDYFEKGYRGAYIRRWTDDFTGKRGAALFDNHVVNGLVKKYSEGKYNGITYMGMRWYFTYMDDDGHKMKDDEPFCYGFSISGQEHDKSTAYPNIKNVIFDEFISRGSYIPNEFVLFMQVLSTIIRDKDDLKIFMCGNTINKYCPYFNEMGLKHIRQQKAGSIDLYEYGTSGLKVAVERTTPNKDGKASDIYFAFDNPKLKMITEGEWELDIYPHNPYKYKPKDILFTYFIMFDGDLLQAEIVSAKNQLFTFIHKKTTDIQEPEKDLIYKLEPDSRLNYRTNLLKDKSDIGKKLNYFYAADKVFYQDNEIGEIINNYLNVCKKGL